jgi:hypothetical protein
MDTRPARTVSVPEAARILGVSRTLAYQLVAQGVLAQRPARPADRRAVRASHRPHRRRRRRI